MIEKLIEYSIRNRYLVMVLAAALTVFAVYATVGGDLPDMDSNPFTITM